VEAISVGGTINHVNCRISYYN